MKNDLLLSCRLTLFSFLGLSTILCSCGGGHSSSSPALTSGPTSPQFTHVFIIVEENHSYGDVVGNVNMPYLNGLLARSGVATQYFADTHPSLPNYFMLTTGMTITGSLGDGYTGTVNEDNVARAVTAAGKMWRFYGEGLPTAGYLGPDTGAYAHHHNPFAYFSDVLNSPAQANNIVPFAQFTADLTAGTLADYSFILPDQTNNAHDCPPGLSSCTDTQKLANTDLWLKNNIDPLINAAAFHNSLLVITFDEAENTDMTNGGGHVPTILISSRVKPGYRSPTLYQHESILRLMLKGIGVMDFPGAAATAPDMTEFFQ